MSEEKEVKVAETQENSAAEVTMASVIHDPNAPVVSVKELLSVGAHFGHMTRRWCPKFKNYIYSTRSGIHIIDLDQTASYINEDYKLLKDIVAKGGKVLFVGTKKSASEAVSEEAIRSGSFYVNHRWLGGTLTNFKTLSSRTKLLKSLEQLENDGAYDSMSKKEAIQSKKEQEKLAANLEGIKEMRKVPDAMIVVDPKQEHNAVAEARILHIPVFALTNTNADPDGIDHIIPCNDDSSKTVKLILGLLADAIVEGKGGDVAYAYIKQDGDEANFVDSLKAVDKAEEFKLIKQRVKEDQYALRKAKKPLAKGMRMRKKPQTFKAKKPFKKTTKPAEAKASESTEATTAAAPEAKASEAK
jgi:small subunit ribosomal protein S2